MTTSGIHSIEKNSKEKNRIEENSKDKKMEVSDSCVDGLQEIINFYNNNIGLLAPYGLEVLESYLKDMDYEVVIFAMKKAVEANVRTIQYIKGTLNNWSKAGVKTLIEAQNENQRFKNKKEENIEETEEERIRREVKEMEERLKNANS